jgi:hypothetical protein
VKYFFVSAFSDFFTVQPQKIQSLDTATMPKQPGPVYVLGVGMTKFIKPRGKVDCKL